MTTTEHNNQVISKNIWHRVFYWVSGMLVLSMLTSGMAYGQLTASFTNKKDACDGLENGSVDVTVTNSSGIITVQFLGPPNYGPFNPTDGVVLTVSGLAPRSYVVIVQDSDETVVYNVDIFNITPDLSASLNAQTDNTDCFTPNGAIDIDVSGGTGSYSYQWTGPNGFTASTQDITGLLGGDYAVDVYDDGTNCFRSLGPFTIKDPVVAVQNITTTDPLALCPGVDAVVDLDGSESGKTYEIMVNGTASGFTTTGTGAAVSITLPDGNFSDGDVLTVEGYEGICLARYTMNGSVTVNINTLSTAPTGATADNTNYCDNAVPGDITLSYSGGSLGTGATAEWYDDAAFTSSVGSGNNLLITPAPNVTTTYYVRFEGTCNTTTAQSVTITVNPSPTPTLSGVSTVCFGEGQTYTTEAGQSNYVWTVSGGTVAAGGTGTDNTVTVTWDGTSPYSVSVTYEDANGCTAGIATSQTITVNPLPTPTLSGVSTVCFGEGQTYTTEAGQSNYVWTVSGGTVAAGGTGTDNTVTVTWDGTSPYSVSVNYEDANGCTAASATSQTITVNPLPSATITGPVAVCANTTETYTVPAGEAAYAWGLTGGDGIISSGAGTNSITVDWGVAGGDLSVTVTGAAPTSCVAASTQTITVFTTLPALADEALDVCQNSALPTLTATPVAGATVNWYLGPSVPANLVGTGDTFTPTAAELDITTPGSTTFTYTQDIGCLVSADASYVVNVMPQPDAGTGSSVAVCASDAALDLFTRLGGTPDTGGTWTDDDNSGALTGSLFDPAVSGDGTFNFTYKVDGTGACTGESATAVVTVTVNSTSQPPVPDQTRYTGCTYAPPPTLTTPGTGITWYADAALTNVVATGNNFTPVDGTDIDLQVIGTTSFYVTQNEGCGESPGVQVDVVLEGVSADIGLVRNTYPEQDIGAIEVLNIFSDNPPYAVSLEDDAGNVIYDWVALEEDRLGAYTYTFTLLAAGDYVVLVRDANGCILPIDQAIGLETDVFIPNVFTPNNDGYNEYFKVLNIEPNTEIVITNRWGVKVFESNNYQNDWRADNLPEGVYFYTIKMGGQVYRGNVEVWRNNGPNTN